MTRVPELRHLAALVALAEEGTFTDAAIRLGVSQSAVSRTIVALESAVGAKLVQRTTRTLSLTPAGLRCYDAAVLALAAVSDVVTAAHGGVRPLRLGYAWSALGRHTTTVLRAWRTGYPDVPLEVHRIDDRSAGLSSGRADVAVMRGDLSRRDGDAPSWVPEPGLASTMVFREPRMAALPVAHSLADRASLTLAELSSDAVLVTSYGTTTLELWPPDSRPTASLQVDNTDEWLTEIAGGLGIGVTAESTATQHAHPGVAFVPLTDAEPLAVYLVWPIRGSHPAVPQFVDLVARVVSDELTSGPAGPAT